MDKLEKAIIEAIEDKKGSNIVSLDLTGIDGAICSKMIICNANSTMQVEAITHGIEKEVKDKLGEKAWRIEGLTNAVWVVMDYIDIMVHVFQTEMRDFYKLEELWADAPKTHYRDQE